MCPVFNPWADIFMGIGKRVAGSLYVHKSALTMLDTEEQELVRYTLKKTTLKESNWNVVRISNDNIAFLNYENFETNPFPTLNLSTRVDLIDARVGSRDFSKYSNPPILHRKELLVASDFPSRQIFADLTSSLDEYGVFYDSHTIGFKDQWETRLKLHGLQVEGHKLIVLKKAGAPVDVQRHRSALVRYQLSQPVQLLIRNELLTTKTSFFDYGCGRRNDVDTLIDADYSAAGWDPFYFPHGQITTSEIVNIGFVLNVIENREERDEAISRAWELTETVLAVSVIMPNSNSQYYAKPYRDGFLTSRGTFQKFYAQDELREYIIQITGEVPVPVSSGIFFVFKNKIEEQNFLLNRFDSNKYRVALPSPKTPVIHKITDPTRAQKIIPVLEHMTSEMLLYGRLLKDEELSPELAGELKASRVAKKTAEQLCLNGFVTHEQLHEAFNARKADILIFIALQLFEKRRLYGELPIRLKHDIRSGWGSYANAQNDARRLLFSIGNETELIDQCKEVAGNELGYLLPEGQLQFHSSALEQLPSILRCYFACASLLYGDLHDADLIKLHPQSAKISLMMYENFESRLPVLRKRVKISLREQRVRVFEYDDQDRQYLYLKSLYIPDEYPGYEDQQSFDQKILAIRDFDFSQYGPDANLFDRYLQEHSIKTSS